MSKSVFHALGGGYSPQQNNFLQFMSQMQGQDPNAIINDLVRSGKLSQQQLNQVQMQVQQMQQPLSMFKSMFGF